MMRLHYIALLHKRLSINRRLGGLSRAEGDQCESCSRAMGREPSGPRCDGYLSCPSRGPVEGPSVAESPIDSKFSIKQHAVRNDAIAHTFSRPIKHPPSARVTSEHSKFQWLRCIFRGVVVLRIRTVCNPGRISEACWSKAAYTFRGVACIEEPQTWCHWQHSVA
jgi:hypothetical protein